MCGVAEIGDQCCGVRLDANVVVYSLFTQRVARRHVFTSAIRVEFAYWHSPAQSSFVHCDPLWLILCSQNDCVFPRIHLLVWRLVVCHGFVALYLQYYNWWERIILLSHNNVDLGDKKLMLLNPIHDLALSNPKSGSLSFENVVTPCTLNFAQNCNKFW